MKYLTLVFLLVTILFGSVSSVSAQSAIERALGKDPATLVFEKIELEAYVKFNLIPGSIKDEMFISFVKRVKDDKKLQEALTEVVDVTFFVGDGLIFSSAFYVGSGIIGIDLRASTKEIIQFLNPSNIRQAKQYEKIVKRAENIGLLVGVIYIRDFVSFFNVRVLKNKKLLEIIQFADSKNVTIFASDKFSISHGYINIDITKTDEEIIAFLK